LVSAIGDAVATIAFALHAANIGSTWFLSALLIANALPTMLLGLIGGFLADRVLRWWWWPAALTGQAALFAAMSTVQGETVIVGMIFMSSVLTALVGPVGKKLIHFHAGEHATQAARHLATATGLAGAVGVALGSLSFGASSTGALLLANAASFLVLAVVSVLVARPEVLVLDTRPEARVLDGFRLMASPSVFGVTGVSLLVALVLSTSLEDISGVFVLLNHSELKAWQYGVALMAWAVSLVLGTHVVPLLLKSAPRRLLVGPLTIGPVFVLTATVLPPWWLVGCLYLAGGLANGGFNAALNETMLGRIPAHQQGRAWAAFGWIISSCLLVGYMVSGLLGESQARLVMTVSGGLTLLVGLAAAPARIGTGPLAVPEEPSSVPAVRAPR
jgi:MFS family permease